jgi:ATP synthase protein I
LSALVRVERLIQLALLLPAATFVGWAIGYGLDQWLHQHWIYLAGLIVGAFSGFVQVFRVVSQLNKE